MRLKIRYNQPRSIDDSLLIESVSVPIQPILPANILFPNRFAHYFLHSLEAQMGKNGIRATLQHANLAYLIDKYPPADDQLNFDYAEFSMLNGGLEALVGRRLGRGFARRAGRHMLQHHLLDFGGAMANMEHPSFQALSAAIRMKLALPPITSRIIQGYQPEPTSTIVENDTHFVIRLETCPACWGRVADNRPGSGANEPLCGVIVGMYEGALARINQGQRFKIVETACIAQGASCCEFEIAKQPFAP